jgi:PAS domain S-box-containing protein
MKSTNRIIGWLVAAGMVLVMAVTVSFWAFQQIEDSVAARQSGYHERNSAQELLVKLAEAESSQRGYTITSDESFLKRYTESQDSIHENMRKLQASSAGALSYRHLAAADALIESKQLEMSKVVALTRSHDTKAATAWVQNATGQHLMDSIQAEMNEYIRLENATLTQHGSELKSNLRRLFFMLVTGSALALMANLAIAFLIYQKSLLKLKGEVHLETQAMLALEKDLNQQLHQSNQALAEGREKLRVMLNSMGDAVIATDASACITLMNPVAARLTGWSEVNALGQKVDVVFRILNTATRSPAAIPVMAALAHGTIQGLANHTKLIGLDGQELDIADSCAPIMGSEHQVIGAILVFRDVTREYAAQRILDAQTVTLEKQNDLLRLSRAALDAARARYFDLYDLAPVGYCTLGENALIVEANLTASRMLGLDAGELAQQNMARFVSKDHFLVFDDTFRKVVLTGMPQSCEVQMLTVAGALIWTHLSLSHAQEHGATSVRIVINDVSDRKWAEASLVKANALQTAMFHSTNFSSIATDANGVIQIFNVGAERMLGYCADDVMNKSTPADLTDPADVIARAKALTSEMHTDIAPGFEALVFKASRGIEDIYEMTYVRKDGSRFPALISVTALRDTEKAIIGYLLICIDNTERKRIEAERLRVEQVLLKKNVELESARQEADTANLAKSDFISGMSHELRTPLGAILGFAQLIESGSPAPTPIQRRSLEQILKAGWYLLELINEILDLAKVESGRLTLSMEPVSLAEVFTECEAMVEPQAQKYGIQLHFERLLVPYRVQADRIRVKQVLINLLSNAIKYNRPKGTVTVRCTVLPEEIIRVSVQDTGEGLTDDMLTQLFQPFNRLGQKGKVEDGTGIGLVVSKRLVELMHGTIGVKSKVGQGSIFWFELSQTHEALISSSIDDQVLENRIRRREDASLKTLLYVEDNPANMMLVEDLIGRRPDIRLLSAMDGNTGVDLARAALPDVILMDINLPGISGLKALSVLARDPTTSHIPVIALSANAVPRDIEKGLEAGFFMYLTKPLKITEFTTALNRAIEFSETHLHDAAIENKVTHDHEK